ncbi:STAS domain-containing protein [Prauserella muralis]|uniref:Anti-sigma factor antagonist n=1 Tax=Prauserella muralis TaxID=588067 RepID=A0A2V4AQA6_9PSEU|nr:STAS domain-containing protein [Prauserella muralis]PXY22204.1 hypothetical protein BAY60_20150 [Prauserella muralis]TWE27833.1 anti-sigma-factor antagonist [Prauserella muralis]
MSDLLDVRTESAGDTPTIVVAAVGEVDLGTVDTLRAELHAAAGRAVPPGPLVADLSDVSFFGSAGLTVLMSAHEECAARDIAFRVVAPSRTVLRPLQLTGLDEVLELTASREEALATASASRS